MERLKEENHEEALKDFEAALDYPVGRWGRSRKMQHHYLIGTAHEALGNAAEANAHYKKAANSSASLKGEGRATCVRH